LNKDRRKEKVERKAEKKREIKISSLKVGRWNQRKNFQTEMEMVKVTEKQTKLFRSPLGKENYIHTEEGRDKERER